MTVARVTEISSTSDSSFEDAVRTGVERACRTLRNVRGGFLALIRRSRVFRQGRVDRLQHFQPLQPAIDIFLQILTDRDDAVELLNQSSMGRR